MRDLTPSTSFRMQYIEQALKNIADQNGYMPIQFPILESAALFQKSIGIETDIIGSEMYAFEDKSDTLVALRPEGTAGCLRSCLANGLIQRDKQKLYYIGPMFRRERPQMGRYRQFQHFGIEVYGYPSGSIDAELIIMTHAMWQALNLKNVNLHINYLGSPNTRTTYREQLKAYWQKHIETLSEAEQKRAIENPLRLLDSKNPDLQDLIKSAPKITTALNEEEQDTFACIQKILSQANIPFTVTHTLVRGLDYYSDFIFEWISDDLGAQSTICGGGRYDPLVSSMGADVPAVGFAIGIDRVEAIMPELASNTPKIYFASSSSELINQHLATLMELTAQTPIYIHHQSAKFKNQLNNSKNGYSHFAFMDNDQQIKVIHHATDQADYMTIDEFSQWCQSLSE